MAKRPPARATHRKPAAEGILPRMPVVEDTRPGGGEADAGAERPPRPAASREQFAGLLAQALGEGHISVADEAAILREYDRLLLELTAEKQRLEADYRDRIARDGQADADTWLRGEAERLGRHQGEQLHRLVKTIPALAAQVASAPGSGAPGG